MTKVYLFLAALAIIGTLLGGAYLKGRADGRAVEKAIQIEEIEKLNDALDKKQAELAALEAARLEQMRELEDRVEELRSQANEDPDADRPAIGVDSVRRLNSIH